jgi:hypothetical protein
MRNLNPGSLAVLRIKPLLRTGAAFLLMACAFSFISMGCGKTAPVEPTPQAHVVDEPPPPEPTEEETPKVEPSKPAVLKRGDRAIFLGTHAVGQRFCIIADASNSMKGAPLEKVKKEIMQTLGNLQPTSQFYIIFFNASDIPMPYPSWLDADKENVEKVKPWVNDMSTLVKTLPHSAFERAFKLQPKSDVIFFMTDGFIPAKENTLSRLARLNAEEPKVVIHTILFTRPKAAEAKVAPAADQLREIAEKNGGTFRRVSQK